ncbi:MAG: amidohydrolase family protein [Verrucomicrobiota bacterium]
MNISNSIVFFGPELEPHTCELFSVEDGIISKIELGDPIMQIEEGALVLIPGLYNSHTHMGDSILPDGATGMTLEQGFFRPKGYKYRELAKAPRDEHLKNICAHLRYMARTGTVGHIDFREQGVYGSELLREASEMTGVNSIILGQFNELPFTSEELDQNSKELTENGISELEKLLGIADGFSESTMNDLTDPAWSRVRELTNKAGKLRAIHCLENEGYRNESLRIAGRGDLIRAIELFAPHLIIHLTVADPDEIRLLKENKVNGVLNPRANGNLGLPIPPVRALLDAGINLMLGTDNGLLNSPNMFAELDYTYKITKSQYGDAISPDPLAILKMATSNVRSALNDAYPVGGYLAEGMPADFCVLNFHQPHLRRSRHLPASVTTRVTPEDVLATYRSGNSIWQSPEFPP